MIFPNCENERLKVSIQNFIVTRRIPHAMIIEGENAAANAELALYIASAAVCGDNSSPCGKCRDCHLAKAGTHPDITRVSALEGKKFLSVAQIRDVRADAFVKAHSAQNRVFIIEDAHRMNEQAQNALLKVLEEPPKNVIFILLTTSRTLLLDTIISRCVMLSQTDTTGGDDALFEAANNFIDLLLSGNEYEMLKLLSGYEKNRVAAEEFLNALSLQCVKRIRKAGTYARALDSLYEDIKYYKELLKTNINMSLFTSVMVSRSKALL